MERIENAILRTVLYADVFDFPLTVGEIHHFLIHNEPVSLAHIESTLHNSLFLADVLICEDGYFARADKKDIIPRRLEREIAAEYLWPQSLNYGRWLARLPFVRMVALTGALAMHNAHEGDDLDYLLVTSIGRVWIARLFAVVLVRIVKLRTGVIVCPNYVLAENALEQQRQDLFIAHEIAQMVPLFGHALYHRMRCLNLWADDQLPNATVPYYGEEERSLGNSWAYGKQGIEILLGGKLGDWLEGWEHRRKVRRFASELQTIHSSAQLDRTQVKGHFNDHGHPVLSKYLVRLQKYGLIETPVAGD